MLRIALWVLIGVAAAVIAFFAATIRVVEPQPATVAAAAVPVTAAGRGPGLIVPVVGVEASRLRSNWGDARGDGSRAHQGLDIMAPAGTAVIAAADGTIEKLYYSKGGGGITLYERSDDRRWTYYYAHLSGYAPGAVEGKRIRAGEPLGYVGDTGNAGTGNFHLHFGIAAMAPGERWHQGTPVDPYPLLAGARRGS